VDGFFGCPVARAGDVNGDGYDDLIVGDPVYPDPVRGNGAAFLFMGSASGIPSGSPETAAARLVAHQQGTNFGASVAAAGDVNGDGYDDVIVGAPYYDADQTDAGAAFVFHGSATGIADAGPESAATRLASDRPSALFGYSVAGAGDANADGYADVIVGALNPPAAGDFTTDEGAAYVFLGSASGIADATASTAALEVESNQPNALFGEYLAGAGDVNGDGHGDVIVGAPRYDTPIRNDAGAAFVFLLDADADGDQVPDSADNCQSQPNPSQLDVDGDGFGNACDADFDDNGISGISDYGTFRSCYGQAVPASAGPPADPTCAESDMNGDRVVGVADYGLFRSGFGSPPGPSSAR
jgi:hypothetical protein